MSNFRIEFARPWLLLLLIPALVLTLIPYFHLAKKFRKTRNRVISVTLHTLAMVLCIMLLAGISFAYDVPNKQNELILLVDRSDSNRECEAAKDEFIQSIADACDRSCKLGIVTFGYNTVYAAPLSYDAREVYRQYLSAAEPDVSATDIASAITFASEQFDNPKTAKILILSDGLETDETALNAVKFAAAKGIRVDAVAFPNPENAELQILDVTLPEEKVIVGQAVKATLTIESNLEDGEFVSITVYDKGFAAETYTVPVQKGQKTVEIEHTFQSSGMHDLRFELSSGADTEKKNNVYHTYLNIAVFENILILENNVGEASTLQKILSEDHTVTVINIHESLADLPTNVKELSAYEQVVLVNMANSDLTGEQMPDGFVETLYDYVYHLGGSLLTVGGENDIGADGKPVAHAYNREDMAGTLFQEMLPVQAIDYSPPIAVMIVVDASGSMSSGRLDAALNAAKEIVGVLSDRDYCGVISFSTKAAEEINVIPVSQKDKILDTIEALGASGDGGGGTVFSGAIQNAGLALAPIPVERRHIILITDGNPEDSLEQGDDPNNQNWYGRYIDENNKKDITLSVFAVGMNRDKYEQMQKTAERAHGNFYDIPLSEQNKINLYARQDLADVTLSELEEGDPFSPRIKDNTSVFLGIDSTMVIPTLTGYYGTKLKDGAKIPLIHDYVPIYAEWQLGNGRVGSFLSDLGGVWSKNFVTDSVGIQLIKNISESLAPTKELEPDQMELVVKITEDNYSNRLDVYTELEEGGSVSVTLKPLSEAAIDRYNGTVPVTSLGDNVGFDFEITCGGLYQILIEKKDANGNTTADRTLYKTFSYSEEYNAFRDAEEGSTWLSSLADSGNGVVITDPVEAYAGFVKTYPKQTDPRVVFLTVAIICILIDVAVRKFKFKWPHELIREHKEAVRLAAKEQSDREKSDM